MNRFRLKRWHQITLIVLIISSVTAAWRFRIWSYRDYRTYHEVIRYPVGPALWYGQIHPGQDSASFVAEHPPHRVIQIGPYSWLTYYSSWPIAGGSIPMEGISILVKEGRLIHAVAAGCTWNRVFFQMSELDVKAFEKASVARFR